MPGSTSPSSVASRFSEAAPYREMPALTARTCGICPVSHVLASNKACDHLLSVTIPPTAEKLRRIMNLAQITQSHALSFFHLSSPDLLLGWDSDPATRNIFGVMRQDPALARDGIRLRQIGQSIIETLGSRIHPTWVVPGGVSEALTRRSANPCSRITLPEGLEIAKRTYDFFKTLVPKFKDEASHFGNQPTMFLSLVTPKGHLEHYDGVLRIKDAKGRIVEDQVPTVDYQRLVGEAVEELQLHEVPLLQADGLSQGNLPSRPPGPAQQRGGLRHPLRGRGPGRIPHAARVRPHHQQLPLSLRAPSGDHLCAGDDGAAAQGPGHPGQSGARPRRPATRDEGIGVSEAPRGTLMHHYRIDDDGLITWVNLIIATGHNNLAMNQAIRRSRMPTWTATTCKRGCSIASRPSFAASTPVSPAPPTPSGRCRY